MRKTTRKEFNAHVRRLKRQALKGDKDALKSLACIALILEECA